MIFAIYKPKGITSAEALRRIKRKIGAEKIGHAGTLDPLASGILVVATGADTKKISEVVAKEKEYVAKIKFGEISETDDEEGKKTVVPVEKIPSFQEVREAVDGFLGEIEQRPPIFSAVKIAGKEAYKRARKGEHIEIPARKVLIKKIDILNYVWPILELRVVTGPGTYIRSLARDIGERLGTGGYLTELERTAVGEFTREKAVDWEL
jgi:tRNA pseudouridine55 synthase